MASKKKPQTKSPAKRRSSSRQPKTMEELLAQADTPIKSVTRGQKVKGKILEITKKNVSIDIGGKSEGLVAEKAFQEAKSFVKKLKVGDEIEATVLIPETPDGFTILSLRAASQDAAWKKVEKAQKKGEKLSVLGSRVNPAGITVEVAGIMGFIPRSLLGKEAVKSTQELVGKRFDAVPIEVDRASNKVVLSESAVSEAENIKLVKDALDKVKEGEVFNGSVTKLYAFGAFVRIKIPVNKKEETPVEGLVHISELSWEKVKDTGSVVSEGDKVKVKVIGKEGGKLALSMKQAQKDPWDSADKKYKKDKKVKGKVVKTSDFGVFVQLEPGVEGLIHVTKIPPGTKLEEGKDVNVFIEDIDTKARKMSLGLVLTTKPVGYK